MVERERIEQGVITMLKVNMGIKSGEKLLVVTDVPTTEEWVKKESKKLGTMIERSLLAKMVSEISEENFPHCSVEFCVYPSTGMMSAEPPKWVEEKMKESDVALTITTYGIGHTEAQGNASKSGTRTGCLTMFLYEMLFAGGPMDVDQTRIHEECKKLLDLLNRTNQVTITSPGGTNLEFSLEGRHGGLDDGIIIEKGVIGNLPYGEVYIAPMEGTASGTLVVEKGWFEDLAEDMTFVFKEGKVVEVTGGGKVGDKYKEMLACEKNEEPYISRRNCAELGIGTNPNAKRRDNILEGEKIKGTIHIAIGDNSHMGGKIVSDLHQDFIVPRPTMKFDGEVFMRDGNVTMKL